MMYNDKVTYFKKKLVCYWKFSSSLIILCSFIVITQTILSFNASSTEVSSVDTKEEKATEKQNLDKVRVSNTQKNQQELDLLRRRYAELYIQNKQLEEKLENIELTVAGMLIEQDDDSSNKALSKTLRAVDRQIKNSGKALKELDKLEKLLDKHLKNTNLNNKICKQIVEQIKLIRQNLIAVKMLPSKVAGQGNVKSTRFKCSVVAKNNKLQIVVLNVGSKIGIHSNEEWCILDNGKVVAEVKIVEVRDYICAAMIVKGTFKTIKQGAVARLK